MLLEKIYGNKLPPSPWYIFAPPHRYIFPPPLTVYYFATASMLGKTPLEHFAVIVPETEMSSSGVHWLRDPP